MENLIDKLKVLIGRKLSKKEMKRAVRGEKSPIYAGISPKYYGQDVDNLSKEGDKIIRKEVFYELATTQDASHGSKILHTNYYPVKSVDKEYNKEGFLDRKEVSYCQPFGPQISNKITLYETPGQFIGEESQRYQNVISVIPGERRNELIVVENGPESGMKDYDHYRVSHITSLDSENKMLKQIKYQI